MALPAFLPLLAYHVSVYERAFARADARTSGARAALPLVLVVALAAPFVVKLWKVRQEWPRATGTFARATGIAHPHPKFRDLAALLAYLDAEPAKQRPIFVLTGEAMIYFLSARVSPLEREEYLVQLVARNAASPESASLLTDEGAMLRRLKAARPLIVYDARTPVRARFGRLFPAIERLLRTRYGLRASFGNYRVLDRVAPEG
jgi:hypothetical protein